jgi:hypothetical protein
MTPPTQQEKLDLYTRALSTMTEVLEALRDEPDPDGALSDLAYRIEAEREWVRASMALGEEPRRPLGWLRRLPSGTA